MKMKSKRDFSFDCGHDHGYHGRNKLGSANSAWIRERMNFI